MGPVVREKSAWCRVLIDGHPPGPAHGTDVDAQGIGTVSDQRLVPADPTTKGVEDHEFQVEFFEPGVQVLVFTFG